MRRAMVEKTKGRIVTMMIVLSALCLLALPPGATADWMSPTAISRGERFSGIAPQIATDATGNSTAIWEGPPRIEAASQPAGGNWQESVSVASGSVNFPQIAVDAAGDATAVWDARGMIQAAGKPAGEKWEAPVDLSTGGGIAFSGDEPQVAVDPAGNAIAVWRGLDGSRSTGSFEIQAASKPAGAAWGTPVTLAVGAVGKQRCGGFCGPKVAFDSAGDATVVWHLESGEGWTVGATTMSAGGSWETPVTMSLPGQGVEQLQVAVDSAGDTVAVWRGYELNSSAPKVVDAATLPAGGTWSAPAQLSSPGQAAGRPQVAFGPNGDATAVWQSRAQEGVIQAASLPAEGTWQAPVDISIPGGAPEEPEVAVDTAGNTIALWSRSIGKSTMVVQAASLPAGGSWQAPVEVSPPVTGLSARSPQIALDPEGNARAIWQQEERNGTTTFDVIQTANCSVIAEAPCMAAPRVAGNLWGGGGGTSQIRIDVGPEPTVAGAHATVTFPDETQLEVPLEAVGSGRFEAPFTVPFNPTAKPQTYGVTVTAETAEGLRTLRQATPITVEPKGTPNPGFLTLEPSTLRFGPVSISHGPPATQTFVLRNPGKPGSPPVSGVLRSSNLQFSLPGTEEGTRFTLAPGEERTFEVAFLPTEKEQQAAELTLNRTDGRQPNTVVSLFGWGLK